MALVPAAWNKRSKARTDSHIPWVIAKRAWDPCGCEHPGFCRSSVVLIFTMVHIPGSESFVIHPGVRALVQHDNLVATNNALMVDLTGQVASETIGPRLHTRVGGQTAFSIAANYSKGGRSITFLPSIHVISGQRVSRIVPALPEAAAVTVPRTLVD